MSLENNYVFNLLKQSSHKLYLVGGAVRDYLMGKDTHDCDIIVEDIPAKDFVSEFVENNDIAASITLDEENNIYRIIMADKINYIDVTNPVNNSFEEDIKRRDLTINALAMDIKNGEIIDMVGGQQDLKNKVIRAVSEENFVDDPLRIIRAYRFASVLGFEIESETKNFIEKHKGRVMMPAVERRNCEILKLFGGKYADRVLLDMDRAGL
ncbi:MAG: hypothetical protein K6E29_07400, partial [Cyanobacteria bacterium RUI128]|nr:hypothetical protein [Cyanobacteria bacterium RUI128]